MSTVEIILAIFSAYMALINVIMSAKKNQKSDNYELAQVETRLEQLLDSMRDLKKEITGFRNELKDVTARVVILETKIEELMRKDR